MSLHDHNLVTHTFERIPTRPTRRSAPRNRGWKPATTCGFTLNNEKELNSYHH